MPWINADQEVVEEHPAEGVWGYFETEEERLRALTAVWQMDPID